MIPSTREIVVTYVILRLADVGYDAKEFPELRNLSTDVFDMTEFKIIKDYINVMRIQLLSTPETFAMIQGLVRQFPVAPSIDMIQEHLDHSVNKLLDENGHPRAQLCLVMLATTELAIRARRDGDIQKVVDIVNLCITSLEREMIRAFLEGPEGWARIMKAKRLRQQIMQAQPDELDDIFLRLLGVHINWRRRATDFMTLWSRLITDVSRFINHVFRKTS